MANRGSAPPLGFPEGVHDIDWHATTLAHMATCRDAEGVIFLSRQRQPNSLPAAAEAAEEIEMGMIPTQEDPRRRASPDAHEDPSLVLEIDRATEMRVARKIDLHLIPVMFLLFLVAFADRSNIGNAKAQEMGGDLDLSGHRYNIAVLVFTVAYVTFAIPANLLFRLVGPKSLAGMMILWGLCALCQGFVSNFGGLVACRFLMGAFESGFLPGCAYLISTYYKREEFLKRYAIFFSASIVAGAFNGLFSGLLAQADGAGGLEGWRWIFIIEGVITIAAAAIAYFMIPNFSQDTKLFQGREKAVLLGRLRLDGGLADNDNMKEHVLEALLDWKIWLATLACIGAEENASSVVAFLPSILKGFGYTSTSAQWHTVPIYGTAFVLTLTCAYAGERFNQRYFFAMFGAFLNLLGLIILVLQPASAGFKYAAAFLLTAGCYIIMPIVVVWNAINVGPGYKRIVAFAMSTAVANSGALISSNVFLSSQEPCYETGFAVGISMNVISILAMTALYIGLRVGNMEKAKRRISEMSVTIEGQPRFVYAL